MKTTRDQFLEKRLLIPLLLVEIAAMGVGLSSPARSTSLTALQGNECAAKLPLISREGAEPNLLASRCRLERRCRRRCFASGRCVRECYKVRVCDDPSSPPTAPASP